MKTKFLFIALVFALVSTVSYRSNAQLYKSALGLRLGAANGITFKTLATKCSIWGNWVLFVIVDLALLACTRCMEEPFNSRDFNWFIGGGGHVYMGWRQTKLVDWRQTYRVGTRWYFWGWKVKIRIMPLAISLDWKPCISIINYSGFWGDGLLYLSDIRSKITEE